MKKFEFRLNLVLRVREAEEEAAKVALLAKQSELMEVDASIEALIATQYEMAQEESHTVQARLDLAARFELMDTRMRGAKALRSAVEVEAETLRRAWFECRREAETLRKLRDKEYLAWQAEAIRLEQIEMDEFAQLRKVA